VDKSPSYPVIPGPPDSMCSVPQAVLPSVYHDSRIQDFQDSISHGVSWADHTRLGLSPCSPLGSARSERLSPGTGAAVAAPVSLSSGADAPEDSSYVHADETTVSSDRPFIGYSSDEPQPDRCVTFRHSGWAPRRAKIRRALIANGQTGRSLERFDHCGESAWIMRADGHDNIYALRSSTCRCRWCEPCSQEKRRIIQSNVVSKLKGRHLRFLTLTLKGRPDSLSDQLDRIVACFRKLRQAKEVRPYMTGGVFFFEVTYNEKARLWHPHLHILFEGNYIDYRVLKRLWLLITNDSYVLDIRPVGNSATAAGYIAKYAGKPVDSHIIACESALNECIRSFVGRRTFNVFGSWRGLDLSKNPESTYEWLPVAPLSEIMDRAAQGEPWARSVLSSLRGGSLYVCDQPNDSS